ncbi:cilia- and flagella-associated protein 299 isoform X2 [Scaptodrosophila lebanonensis]|uniref:Cilia- and flagella-associated protein 299 n=1 Tax=Drosophila lebanonensis TaxID=7225 RepID=A0A6J2UBH9_DROLE|nr:cilia- and flagella-associated protein 299 isoform X2 [Scaptodrosophila lebanonensis]
MNLLAYNTYEDYLDAFITTNDIRYMRNWPISRRFVQNACGHSCMAGLLMREEFDEKRRLAAEAAAPRGMHDSDLFGVYLTSRDRVLHQFAKREMMLITKKISSGLEVSGFIDLEQSLRESRMKKSHCFDWRAIFEGKAKLMPRRRDISYRDWYKNAVSNNGSDNFSPVEEGAHSLLVKHRGDHKFICINAGCECPNSQNARRSMYNSRIYGQVIFFDHYIRRIN